MIRSNMNKLTPEIVENSIASEWYINGATGVVPDGFQPPVTADSPLNRLTICVLVLQNGFLVTGESYTASLTNFNEEIGKRVARANAVEKIWGYLGYALVDQLYNGGNKQ